MRVSVVAALIVGVHVAVIGSVVMTQGCVSTQRGAGSTAPEAVPPAPAPVLPPSAEVVSAPAIPHVAFPEILPPAQPGPMDTAVSAKNIYVVKSGDQLAKIAAAHGVRTSELKELNQIADANKIRIGQKLILPDYAKPSKSPAAAKDATPAKEKAAAGEAYVVKPGDSLSKIASQHGVKMKDLQAANNLTDPNKIRVGQKLVIPAKAAKKEAAQPDAPAAPAEPAVAPLPAPVPEAVAAPAPAPTPATPATAAEPAAPAVSAPELAVGQEALLDYTVQDGDTAESIARLFVVRKDDILRINSIGPGADVQPGQKIKIPPSSP